MKECKPLTQAIMATVMLIIFGVVLTCFGAEENWPWWAVTFEAVMLFITARIAIKSWRRTWPHWSL